ncbi:MAG: ABC transporter substrate-binding protein [Beijerinckiaceae bacterium]
MRRVALAVCAAAIVLILSLPAQAQTVVRLGLDWRYEGQSALFLHGIDKGFYKDEGLDIAVEPGNGSRDTVGRVAAGQFDIGVGDATTLVRYRDENPASDLKAVMVVYDRSPAAIIGRKSRGIGPELATLTGKKIAAPAGDGAFAQWPVFRAVNKIPDNAVRIEAVGFPVREPMLATGEVDAVFGFAHTTPINLRARNVPADDLIVLMMADYGLESYGNLLIANTAFRTDQPDVLRRFIKATMRSIRDVIANPDEAVGSVLRRSEGSQRGIELDRLKQVIAQSVITTPVLANGLGAIDPDRWGRFIDQAEMAAKFKDRARAADGFNAGFLPPADERRIPAGN